MTLHQTPKDVETTLSEWLNDLENLVILGVGNSLRKDDSAGLRVIDQLEHELSYPHVKLIKCDTIPENYLGVLEKLKPSHIIIVDAADAGLPPGSIFHSSLDKVEGIAFSTHNIPLKVFAQFISETTKSKITLLGVQSADIGFGQGLTSQVEEGVLQIINILKKMLSDL